MKLEKHQTVETIEVELVRRMTQKRLSLGLTQNDAAERAGIAPRTLRRLELGKNCHFSTIIRILNAYGLINQLDQLVPEPTISPIAFVDQQKKTNKNIFRVVSRGKNSSWKWGDEQ